ncbi:MAG: transcriptional regulator [Clostridia bacterium]|nr:transcriptional regulator [Clostridia bacterium]
MLRITDKEARALGYIYGLVSAKMPEEYDRSGAKYTQAMQYPFVGFGQITAWGHKYRVITQEMNDMIADISTDIDTIPEGSMAEQFLPLEQQSIWMLAYYAGLNGKPYFDIARAREQAGMSQEELAEKLGVPQSSVSRWESGKVQPRAETLDKIRAILDVNK